MTDFGKAVEGTVCPDGTLKLDEKVPLPPGRVRVLVQPLPSPSNLGPSTPTVGTKESEGAERFRRDAQKGWFLRGALLGGAIGAAVSLTLYFVLVCWPGGIIHLGEAVEVFVLGGLVAGGLGGAGVLVWRSLIHPVLLALFSSERFLREYGTPEERGLVGPDARRRP
jgi:hypothetical protein